MIARDTSELTNLMLKLKKNKKSEPKAGSKDQPAKKPQGIVAKGNALKSIAVIALLAAIAPVALGFSYLIVLRDPTLQTQQIERIAASFATQQATSMHRLIVRLRDRIHSAAGSPLALSAIANQSGEDIGLVEQAMLDYFPEVISLKIVTIGEMGTAQTGRRGQWLTQSYRSRPGQAHQRRGANPAGGVQIRKPMVHLDGGAGKSPANRRSARR